MKFFFDNNLAIKPNPDWAALPLFQRQGWTRMPFGSFAESVNVRVEPAYAAEEVYVGLDDLDPGCLHIRRWGKGSDVIGTSRLNSELRKSSRAGSLREHGI